MQLSILKDKIDRLREEFLIQPEELISRMEKYTDKISPALIKKAYVFALNKHGTQIRESGDPYFSHPLEVAEILISLKMDQETVIAGMLHDTIEDTDATLEELTELFGEKITTIVNGVTKLSKFEISSIAEKQTENFKKLLLSAASDIRVLIIKLADRLHNMKTLKYKKKKSKRAFIAKETLEVYAPLAERVGIIGVKDELEDIAFMELYPDIYNSIKSRLKKLYESSEEMVSMISKKLFDLSKNIGISCTITGRLKTPYSIWQKMNIRNISFEQLSDIMAFRIIVDTIPQCYQMLGLIHRNYLVVPGRFRDYISTPKNNSYQSLHTSVIGPLNKRIEVQIRTKEMHLVAEYGIAAHWDYKSGASRDKEKSKTDVRWINSLVNILENTSGMEEFLENSRTEVLSDKVFCITPKGTIVSLPKGASVLDFAYTIHSDVGNHAVGAKVNGNLVPLKTPIENGDQVEVMTDPNSSPKHAWEGFVVTIKAKSALKKELNAIERERIEMIGRSNFDEFFLKNEIKISDADLRAVARYFKFEQPSALFYSIGTSETTMREILKAYNKIKETNLDLITDEEFQTKKNHKKKLPINSLPNIPVLPVTCCTPVPGDKIVGIVFQDRGIEIHIEECPVFTDQQGAPDSRIIPLSWSPEAFDDESKYLARLTILVLHASGNLTHIAEIIEKRKANIINLNIAEKFENFVQIRIELEVKDISQLTMIMADLRSTEAIKKVLRS